VESGELREDRAEEVGVGTMGALVEGQPSRTAMVVALMRAAHTRSGRPPLSEDPWADCLVPEAMHAFASPCRTVSAQVPAASVATPPPVRNLLIDPLMLSSVKEYRNIMASIGAEIFPEWKANSVPILP
jgi:O-methyltransferase involved in polyketide biosynthesis